MFYFAESFHSWLQQHHADADSDLFDLILHCVNFNQSKRIDKSKLKFHKFFKEELVKSLKFSSNVEILRSSSFPSSTDSNINPQDDIKEFCQHQESYIICHDIVTNLLGTVLTSPVHPPLKTEVLSRDDYTFENCIKMPPKITQQVTSHLNGDYIEILENVHSASEPLENFEEHPINDPSEKLETQHQNKYENEISQGEERKSISEESKESKEYFSYFWKEFRTHFVFNLMRVLSLSVISGVAVSFLSILPNLAVMYFESLSQPGEEYAQKIITLQQDLCQNYYLSPQMAVNLEDWLNESNYTANVQDIYIQQYFHIRKEQYSSLLQPFNWARNKTKTRRILLVAEQGEGKTTSVKKAGYDWCRTVLNPKYQFYLQRKYQQEYLLTKKPTRKQENDFWQQFELYMNHMVMWSFENIMKIPEPLDGPEVLVALEFKDIGGFKNLSEILQEKV